MEKKKSEKSQVLPIGRILPDVLDKCRQEKAADLTVVGEIWRTVVEAAVTENTQPAAFKGQLLLVHVSSSVWLHQLQFVKQDLIDKVNAAAGRHLVADITFKIGPLEKEDGSIR